MKLENVKFPTTLKVTIGSQSPTDGFETRGIYTIYFYSIGEVNRMIQENEGTGMYLEFSEN